jgi:sRNA-binding protein
MNYFSTKHREVLDALRARDFPVPEALSNFDEPRPLALTTRSDIEAYVACHGGGDEEIALMGRAVSFLTKAIKYIKATARDGAVRVSITGEIVGPVSEEHRAAARRMLEARAARAKAKASAGKPRPPPPQAPRPPAPPPSPPAAQMRKTAPNPFRRGAPISAEEVERRRQALASLKPKAAHGRAQS